MLFHMLPALQRDSNMSVDEVRQQVEHVALVTKQASSVSDLRHISFLAPSIKARSRSCAGTACIRGGWEVGGGGWVGGGGGGNAL